MFEGNVDTLLANDADFIRCSGVIAISELLIRQHYILVYNLAEDLMLVFCVSFPIAYRPLDLFKRTKQCLLIVILLMHAACLQMTHL
ncbi:hypothetical protein ADT32_03700 [Xylella fastidiosa]|nr:hypothetical protein OY18_01135 [Xylella fastidiosa]OCA58778.1 hypothetical protein AA93_01145 [Xylella fastidiosa subsp. pauca 11399]AVI22054.1 hypothetical protein BC375_01125 [Xylella fastidiosa]KIA59053.1 hypothetical protein RA12_01150 [Xylella fastidiosa]KXB12206.1 hypothetical protein ADT32_03700 [Xylella fastidiosa]